MKGRIEVERVPAAPGVNVMGAEHKAALKRARTAHPEETITWFQEGDVGAWGDIVIQRTGESEK